MMIENPVDYIENAEIIARRSILASNLEQLGYRVFDSQPTYEDRNRKYFPMINDLIIGAPEIKASLEQYVGREIDPELVSANYMQVLMSLNERLTQHIANLAGEAIELPFWLTYGPYGEKSNTFTDIVMSFGEREEVLNALIDYYLKPYNQAEQEENKIEEILLDNYPFVDHSALADIMKFSNTIELAVLDYSLRLDSAVSSRPYVDKEEDEISAKYMLKTGDITLNEEVFRRQDKFLNRLNASLSGLVTGVAYTFNPIFGAALGAGYILGEAVFGNKTRERRRSRKLDHEIVHDLGYSVGFSEQYGGLVEKNGIMWRHDLDDFAQEEHLKLID